MAVKYGFFLFFVLFSLPVQAGERVPVSGEACYTYGDNETYVMGKNAALDLAKQSAIENHRTFVQSRSMVEDMMLAKQIIATIAAGSLYNMKTEILVEEGRKICMAVDAEVDPDEVDEAIKNAIAKSKKAKNKTVFIEQVKYSKEFTDIFAGRFSENKSVFSVIDDREKADFIVSVKVNSADFIKDDSFAESDFVKASVSITAKAKNKKTGEVITDLYSNDKIVTGEKDRALEDAVKASALRLYERLSGKPVKEEKKAVKEAKPEKETEKQEINW